MFAPAKQPAATKKPFNINDVQTSTNAEAIPVPWFAGCQMFAVDWISEIYNKTSKTQDSGGKEKVSGKSQQKKWYGDIAGVTNVCMDDAPVDGILAIFVNDEIVYDGNKSGVLTRAPGSHYIAFSLPKYCQECRFYWGTKDQPIDDLVLSPRGVRPGDPGGPPADPSFNPKDPSTWPRDTAGGGQTITVNGKTLTAGIKSETAGHYDLHPAYRNQGLFVAKQFFLGNSPNMPNVTMNLVRGVNFFTVNFQSGFDGLIAPWPLYELFRDDMFGLGLTDDDLDVADWGATADALGAQSYALSPKLTNASAAQSVFANYLQYFDGYLRRNGEKIGLGIYTHGNIDVASLPAVGSDDLTGEPNIKPGNLADTKNSVFVTYSNNTKFFKDDDTDRYIDQANFTKQGIEVEDRINAPHIVEPSVAAKYAAERCRILAIEQVTGSVPVGRERIPDLRVGDRFKTNVESLSLSFVWRVRGIDQASDRDGSLKLTLENERGIWPTLFYQPPAAKPPDFKVIPTPIVNARILELPSGQLKDSDQIEILILAQRADANTLGFKVHVSADNGTSYDPVGTIFHFASYGRIAGAAYPNTTPVLDTVTGMLVDLFGVDLPHVVAQSDSDRDDNSLLDFFGDEIGSVGQVTPLGAGRNQIFQRRALFGSPQEDHFIDAEVWFYFRAWITPLQNKNFVPGSTRLFKLQPFVYGGDLDIQDCVPIPYTFGSGFAVGAVFNLALSSASDITSDGQLEVRIFATWDRFADQDIFLFELQWRKATSTTWKAEPTTHDTNLNFVVPPNTLIGVRVRPINSHGEPGPWSDEAQITSAAAAPFTISGLQVDGSGNLAIFKGRDAHFTWNLNSPSRAPELGNDPVGTGVYDPEFVEFALAVRNSATGAIVWTGSTKVPQFTFTLQQNIAAFGTATVPYDFGVAPVSKTDGVLDYNWLNGVLNPEDAAPTNFAAVASFSSAFLTWKNTTEDDLDHIEIYASATDDFSTSTLIDTVAAGVTSYAQLGLDVGVERFYWLRSVDCYNTKSAVTASANVTPGAVVATDVADFSIKASKLFINTILLDGDVWSNNSPVAGSIAVGSHTLYWRGTAYAIPAFSTAKKFIYWNAGDTHYTDSDLDLPLDSNTYQIAMNIGGVAKVAWNNFANVVIGSANIVDAAIINAKIANLAVDDAKIANLVVSKLIGGTISGQEIIIAGGASGILRSDNYAAGSAGWIVRGDGSVEFNNGVFRGVVTIGAGTNFDAGYDPTTKETPSGAQSKADIAQGIAEAASLDKATYLTPGQVTIDGGKLTANSVAASVLLAGSTFTNHLYIGALLEMAAGGEMQSANFIAGTSGWKIYANGDAEFNSVTIRNGVIHDGIDISNEAMPIFEQSPDGVAAYTALASKSYSTNFFFRVRSASGTKLYLTNDGTEPSPTNPNAFSIDTQPTFFVDDHTTVGFGTSSVTTTLRAKAFSGVTSPGSNSARWTGKSDEIDCSIAFAPDSTTLPSVATPYISRVSGTWGSGASVGVQFGCSTVGATIYYSTDGTNYSAYTAGSTITIPLNGEIHIYAEKPGFNTSSTADAYNDSGSGNPGRLPQ